jgi:1-acyl-sn-glycerol-3-phosphate acyltransferase
MRIFRGLIFLSSLLFVAFGFLPLALVPAPRRWHLKARLLRNWARWILPRIGIHVSEEEADDDAHSGGRVIVANHLSYLDIPILLARAPCSFLGKEEITAGPLIGWIARRSG